MFNNIDDIRKVMYDFRKEHGRYPNVIFISREKKRKFIEEIYYSSILDIDSPIRDYLGDITICGIKIRWTESIDGVDYMEEFEEISRQEKNEYFKKVLKPIKIRSNKRKIIL